MEIARIVRRETNRRGSCGTLTREEQLSRVSQGPGGSLPGRSLRSSAGASFLVFLATGLQADDIKTKKNNNLK